MNNNNSIFKIDLGLSPEYSPLISDLLKFATIMIVYYGLSTYAMGSNGNGKNKTSFLYDIIFILIGVATYHMIVKKLIIIDNKEGFGCGGGGGCLP